jgi:hypothetical protein
VTYGKTDTDHFAPVPTTAYRQDIHALALSKRLHDSFAPKLFPIIIVRFQQLMLVSVATTQSWMLRT